MSKISEEPKQKACILDCYCHTEESLKEHDEENFPAIDCCEHCCKEYKQHNAWKRYQRENPAPSLNTWEKQMETADLWETIDDYDITGHDASHEELSWDKVKQFIASQISLAVQKERGKWEGRGILTECHGCGMTIHIFPEDVQKLMYPAISNKGVEEK